MFISDGREIVIKYKYSEVVEPGFIYIYINPFVATHTPRTILINFVQD